jgi:predicted transcriptional regulator
MVNQQVTVSQFDLGWLIGIIDGEGSFWIAKSPTGMTPVVEIVNTNFDIIEKIANILTRLGLAYHVYVPKRSSRQREYKKLEIKGVKRLKKFFDLLMPYFECRFLQADSLNQFVQIRYGKTNADKYGNDELSIYCMLRAHNQRGTGTSETTREEPSDD